MRELAQILVDRLKKRGLQYIYGIPGGNSCLDVIAAAENAEVPFILARTETAAAIMASSDTEVDGSISAVLTAKGPGIASAVNGVAQAWLDRSPVIVIFEGMRDEDKESYTHQLIDQQSLLAPITKQYVRFDGTESESALNEVINNLISTAVSAPAGPVAIELIDTQIKEKLGSSLPTQASPPTLAEQSVMSNTGQLMRRSNRPVLIVGLEARDLRHQKALLNLVNILGCPVLSTYKAKGVFPETHPAFVGLFTGGGAEAETVSEADLIILIGLDPVELIPQPWRYQAATIDISLRQHPTHYLKPDLGLYGDLVQSIETLLMASKQGSWTPEQIRELRSRKWARLSIQESTALSSQTVVEIASQLTPDDAPVCIDAGAHMFSATTFWTAECPRSVFISNGLATMAYALPAAIAVSKKQPDQPVIVFTGDGGLMMCLGELATAVQNQSNIVVIVLNDATLSLIDIKQKNRGMDLSGMETPVFNFAEIVRAMGGAGWCVNNEDEYRQALKSALKQPGPCLIDVEIDPCGYPEQIAALRN